MSTVSAQRFHKGQVYSLVGTVPHTRRDGSPTTLAVWQSHCADCGAAFRFTLPAFVQQFSPNRRCGLHARPGLYVGGRDA